MKLKGLSKIKSIYTIPRLRYWRSVYVSQSVREKETYTTYRDATTHLKKII